MLFLVVGKLNLCHLMIQITVILFMFKWVGLSIMKSHLKMLGLTFLKLDLGSFSVFNAKTVYMSSLDLLDEVSSDIVLYLYTSSM